MAYTIGYKMVIHTLGYTSWKYIQATNQVHIAGAAIWPFGS